MRLPMFFGLSAAATSLVLLMATSLYAQQTGTSRTKALATTPALATKPPVKKVSPATSSATVRKPVKLKRADPCDGGEIARSRRPAVLQRQ